MPPAGNWQAHFLRGKVGAVRHAAGTLAVLTSALAPAGTWAASYRGANRQPSGSAYAMRAHSAIVGGRPARNGQFPWVARIVARRGKVVDACSGTVVAPNLILTAGHCVEDVQSGAPRQATDFEAQTAAYVAGRLTSRSSRVSLVLVYPGFERKSGVGDAALLELSTPTNAPSIPLASEASDWPAGTRALMTGWGRTDTTTRRTQLPFLRWANTVIQSPEWCAAKLRGFHTRRQLCAMNAPNDNTAGCAGDSGGPLLVRRGGETIEIGVLNGSVLRRSTVVTCLTNEPTVFASSSVISGWVHEWIQRLTIVPIAVTEGAPNK
jgi:trypsin